MAMKIFLNPFVLREILNPLTAAAAAAITKLKIEPIEMSKKLKGEPNKMDR